MILYQNVLIKLEYDPATDILYVDMPSVNYDLTGEFKRALDIIVENIKNYDVKKLLVDARKSVINIDPEDYTRIVSDFSAQVKATRLQKAARVVSDNAIRENAVQEIIDEVQPVETYQCFTDMNVAIEWLKL